MTDMGVPQSGGCCMCRRAPNEIEIVRRMAFQKTIGGGTEWIQYKTNINDHVMWAPPFSPSTAETMAGLRYVLRHPDYWRNDIYWNQMAIEWNATNASFTDAMWAEPALMSDDSHCGPLMVREIGFTALDKQRAQWSHDLLAHYRLYNPDLELSDFAAVTGTYGPQTEADLDAIATVQYRVMRIRDEVEEDLTGVQSTYAPYRISIVADSLSFWPVNSDDGIGFSHTFDTPVEVSETDELYVDVWVQKKCMYPWSHPPLDGPAWTVPQEFYNGLVQQYFPMYSMRTHGTPYFASGTLTLRGTDCNYRVKKPLPYRLRFPDGHSWTPGNQPFLDMSKRALSYLNTATFRPGTASPYPAVWTVPTAGNIDDNISTGESGDGLYCSHTGIGPATQSWRLVTADAIGATAKIVVHALVHCGPISGAAAITGCSVALNSTGTIALVADGSNPDITTVPQWLSWESPAALDEIGIPNSAAKLLLTAEGADASSQVFVDAVYVETTFGTQWTKTESLSGVQWSYSGNQDRVTLGWASEIPVMEIKHGALKVTYKPVNPLGYSEVWSPPGLPSATHVLAPGQWSLNEDSTWQLFERTSQNLAIFPDTITLEKI